MDFNLKIAFRDSKAATRPYLIVNPMLAKHLPAKPSAALNCFMQLGEQIADICKNEKVLVIGFAETATAVGAAVASVIEDAVYVHTTREMHGLFQDELLVDFLEEHSHAKNQSLYLEGKYKDLSYFDRLVFVEDEITTGKTILNFLNKIQYHGKITISALVFNGFEEGVFSNYNANFFCLQKIGYIHYLSFDGLPDTRKGVSIGEYQKKCVEIAQKIVTGIGEADLSKKNVLVLGTEEFMYPVLVLGSEIEKMGANVSSQSTTRSPILPQATDGYPIHSRSTFKSVYDNTRNTYLYNLEKYDTTIVVTNSTLSEYKELIEVLQNSGNQTIYFVRVQNV